MWCGKCHNGSEVFKPKGTEQDTWRCNQCGTYTKPESKNPFPDRPTAMGSGRSREQVEKEMAKKGLSSKANNDAAISEDVAEVFNQSKHNQ